MTRRLRNFRSHSPWGWEAEGFPPHVHDYLLGLVYVGDEVIDLFIAQNIVNQLPVIRLIPTFNEAQNSHIICVLNDGIVVLGVIGIQWIEFGAEITALWCSCNNWKLSRHNAHIRLWYISSPFHTTITENTLKLCPGQRCINSVGSNALQK